MEIQHEKLRCAWANKSEIEKNYHDMQWGKPLHNEKKLFEMLLLEGQQAGLSWRTVLQKQENMRKAFNFFNAEEIAMYTPSKIENLMQNKGIIRNRRKINSVVQNAQAYLYLKEKGVTLNNFFWRYVDNTPIKNHFENEEQVPCTSPLSEKISKDLKKQGFSFVGPTIIYSFMQSIGMVNDHTKDCFLYKE